MKNTALTFLLLFFVTAATAQKFTKEEQKLLLSGDTKTMLKVIQITDEKELKILKSVSADVDPKEELLPLLAERMYLAMRDPANPGIGIAAPQVGINRNVIWVQRFDKKGEPFEFYLNPKIVWQSALLRKGKEGCLSIPDISGDVLRNYTIKLTYLDKNGKPQEEIIEGFTAVIFQHETDHIKGILFTDRLKEQENLEVSPVSNEMNLFLQKRLARQ